MSYFASAGTAWIPAVVAALVAELPRLRLDLRLVELAEPGAAIPDVEIAVDGARARESEGFHVHALLTEPYLAVVPLASPLAGRTCVDLLELGEHAWVDNDASRGFCRQVLMDACSAVGFSPSFQVETRDYPTAIAVVAGGMGITVVPRLGLGTLPTTTTAVPIVNPTPRRGISVRVRDTVAEHPAVARVLELLRERTAADAPV